MNGAAPILVLQHDFPLTPARIELDRKFCLRLPHIEADGHFCHGVEFDPADLASPVQAVGRVLSRLSDFLNRCGDPGWVEAEFNRERQDYWIRYAAGATAPKSYRTAKLLLDADVKIDEPQEAAALSLLDGRAFATTSTTEPERLARARAWPLGGIVRGGALVMKLPTPEHWTPSAWPRSFQDLDELLSQLSSSAGKLRNWYEARRWPNKAPVFAVLLQGPAVYGWRILPPPIARQAEPALVPVDVRRVDRQWSLSRDYRTEGLARLADKKVVVFGTGSLGAPLIELLARAGVGAIEVVDPQTFEPENISRHVLGAPHIGLGKAASLCAQLRQAIPGAELDASGENAMQWCAKADQRQLPDLIVDCTGERSVRIGTSLLRKHVLKNAPLMMAWMEPFGSAAHAVLISGNDVWPAWDPAETAVNVASWPDDVQVNLPGCGQGFHPYGVADAWAAACMVSERALKVLNGEQVTSGVWSMIRHESYFRSKSPSVTFNRPPPVHVGVDLVIEHRPLAEVLQSA
ncbi:ThiF family adenylyltransferase [Hydrogenophaga sp. 5NK40-0174]|uniref:ThiF family adenylyltransferase n=1 Tax=Hydrogenophaga sp. 5NK40-0174 TaxID=3127649 RepID=UPI0033425036